MVRRVFALVPLAVGGVSARDFASSRYPRRADLAEHSHWKRLKALVEPRAAANPNDAEAQWLLSRVRMAYHGHRRRARAGREGGGARSEERRVSLAGGAGRRRAGVERERLQADRAGQALQARGRGGPRVLNPKHTGSMIGLIGVLQSRARHRRRRQEEGGARFPARSWPINKVDGWIAKVRLLQQQSPVPVGEIEQAWVQAVQADPSRYEPHINLASIYTGGTTPRWELAEKEALTAKKIDPDRTAPYVGARGGLRRRRAVGRARRRPRGRPRRRSPTT